jgi:hypothetical protein
MRADGIANVTVNALHPASLMPTTMVRYYDGLREARAKPQAYDAAARRKLWKLSESLVRDRV